MAAGTGARRTLIGVVLLATGAAGCAQVTYVTSWDRSPVAHRATEEGGKLALSIQRVRVGHGKVVVNLAARTDGYRIRTVRLSHRDAPPCNSPVYDPDFRQTRAGRGPSVNVVAQFAVDDVKRSGVMRDGSGVVELGLASPDGHRQCLRAPLVIDPKRIEWAVTTPRAWLRTGLQYWSIYDDGFTLSAGLGVTAGPLVVRFEGGIGSTFQGYYDRMGKRDSIGAFTKRLAPGLSHLERISDRLGLDVGLSYDLFWMNSTNDPPNMVSFPKQFLQGPRATVRLIALPEPFHWAGFAEPRYEGSFAAEVSGGVWVRRHPFDHFFVLNFGFSWEYGFGEPQ